MVSRRHAWTAKRKQRHEREPADTMQRSNEEIK